jgi:catechol 2,3-dioxygenase-like lactoylglutathione lyase family enzyme
VIESGTIDNGFHEACAIVRDLDDSVNRLCNVLGYRLLWRGPASASALELLGIDGESAGLEALVGDPLQGRGFIRLFALPGRDSGVMRDGAQPWDAGGIFDINVYALGPIEVLHGAMIRSGFSALAPITAYLFGELSVKEVVERDSDGLVIAMIERLSPPVTGFEAVTGPASYVFNSTQTVPSFDLARAFYVDTLGWKPVQESRWTHEDGNNCLGLPRDVARVRELRVGIYQANGRNEGSVEVLEVAGEALDFSAAAPPDRGWAALRFPVADVGAFLISAAAGGCTILPSRPMMMPPYGQCDAGAAVTPWGARLEAYAPPARA